MQSLQLSELWIYPVKSLGGISLSSSRILPKGLQYDRRWMLVDENNSFLTQRVLPEMALFKLAIDEDHLLVTYNKKHTIRIPLLPALRAQQEVKIWEDSVTAFETSPEHSKWFSEMLRINCKLIHFPENNPRPVDQNYRIKDDHVSLADAFPFLIIGQASLDDLNNRLPAPIQMNRFRPNLVFTGGKPYEEDQWKEFRVGANLFAGVKPCARCAVPTINQDTAEKGIEPTKTLATYRRTNNKIYFGQNVIALGSGTIAVGDLISLA